MEKKIINYSEVADRLYDWCEQNKLYALGLWEQAFNDMPTLRDEVGEGKDLVATQYRFAEMLSNTPELKKFDRAWVGAVGMYISEEFTKKTRKKVGVINEL